MAKWWRGMRIDGPDYDRGVYGGASPLLNLVGRINRARARVGGWRLAAFRYARLFVRITLVVVALDWVSKLAINLRIEAIPNDARLEPVLTPAVFENQWFPLNEAGTLAITHVEHAYESANAKWLVSPYGAQALAAQDWLAQTFGIEAELWVAGLGTLLVLLAAEILLLGLVLRMRPWVIAVSAGLLWGGAIGNQVELGLFGDVTDWLWVSGDIGAWLLGPLGAGQSGVMNLADGAIFIGYYLFGLALLYRVGVVLLSLIRRLLSAR